MKEMDISLRSAALLGWYSFRGVVGPDNHSVEPLPTVEPLPRRDPTPLRRARQFVMLATPGKVLHADERHLEFTTEPPEGS